LSENASGGDSAFVGSHWAAVRGVLPVDRDKVKEPSHLENPVPNWPDATPYPMAMFRGARESCFFSRRISSDYHLRLQSSKDRIVQEQYLSMVNI
jgi:hypothetical protein